MKLYSVITLAGTIAALALYATAFSGYMHYDISVHKALAVTAVLFGLFHGGLIAYRKYFKK